MKDPSNASWYNRPPPDWLPVWLVIALATGITCGSCAVYLGGYTAGTIAIVFGVGFFVGLMLSLVLAARLGSAHPAAPRLRPPEWIAVPVGVAMLVIVAHFLIDDTLREGYADLTYRHGRRRVQLPGPLAVGTGCCVLAIAGWICIDGLWGRPRAASPFIGALLGIAVLIIGLCVILARLWRHFA